MMRRALATLSPPLFTSLRTLMLFADAVIY